MSTFGTSTAQCSPNKISFDRKILRNQMVDGWAGGILNSLSRGAPSTTRPPLRWVPDRRNHLGNQALFREFCRCGILGILQVLAAKTGTTLEQADTNGTNLAQCCSADVLVRLPPMRKFLEVPNWSPGYINVCPHHLVMLVECKACGEKRELDRDSLPQSLRHALVSDVEKRLKCTSCGAKSARMLFGSYSEEE